MKPIVTMALKDLKLLFRDKAGLFWVFAFPLVMAVLFGSIFAGSENGGSNAIRLALTDEDRSPAARLFVDTLMKSEALKVKEMNRPDGMEAVRRGKFAAFVILKKGFNPSAGLFGGQQSALEVGIDPSRRAEAGYLQGILTESTFRVVQQELSRPGEMQKKMNESFREAEKQPDLPPQTRQAFNQFSHALDQLVGTVGSDSKRGGLSFEPVKIEMTAVTTDKDGPRSAFEISFPQSIIWGLIGCAAAFAISIVHERVHGTYLRLCTAPISRWQILAGKGLACFLACILEICVLLAVGRLAFHVRLDRPGPLLFAVLCASLGFTGIMMFLSVLGKSERAVAGAGWGICMMMSMFGGGAIPLLFMPGWMQRVSDLSPVKWAILALEGAIWRGFSAQEMILPCGVLLSVGAVFFSAGIFILRRMDA